MKKAKSSRTRELRSEYTRADFPAGLVRGKYAARIAAGSNIVRLDPEIADAFPTSAAVNEALGTVLRAARSARLTKRTVGRAKGTAHPGTALAPSGRAMRSKARYLLQRANEVLKPPGKPESPDVVSAMATFRDLCQKELLGHSPVAQTEQAGVLAWSKRFAQWLFSTDHVDIGYDIEYDGVDIRKLSPGARGIVLSLLQSCNPLVGRNG